MKTLSVLALILLVSCTTRKVVVESTPPVKNKDSIVLVMTERVFNFAPNSADLDEEDKASLQKMIMEVLKNQNKYRRIEIVGHSDQTGTEDDNLDISKERAINILSAMKEAGIDRKMIRTSWLAGTEPVEENAIESTLNRRVEIRLFASKKN